MAWGETFTAVQQGTIDGLEIPIAVIDSSKYNEVTKFLSLTNHTYSMIALMISKKSMDKLPADLQSVVREAGRTAVGAQRPVATGLIESGLGEPRAQAHVGQQAVLFGQLLHVDLDFRGRGKAARPVGVGREAERIDGGGHIHMRAGVGVVPPGAAQAGLLFDNHEVVHARALQADGHAQPGHASAQDHDLMLRMGGRSSGGQRPQGKTRHTIHGGIGTRQGAGVNWQRWNVAFYSVPAGTTRVSVRFADCFASGGGVTGLDNCDRGAMCRDVMGDMGHCVAL